MPAAAGPTRSVLARLAFAAILLAGASCTGGGPTDEPSKAGAGERGHVEVVYEDDAIEPENREAVDLIREAGFLERLAEWTNEAIELPHDMVIRVSDDMPEGVGSPIAEPNGRTILLPASFFTLSHEVLTEFVNAVNREDERPSVIAEEEFDPDVLLVWAEEFIVAHEMGHALIHQLLLPTTGLEEDAVDSFAAFYTLNYAEDGGDAAIGAATLFDELALEMGDPTVEDFASDHPITQQRVFNFLCFLAGSDPALEDPLVGEGYLPEERSVICPLQWAQLSYGWWETLEPHFTVEFREETADARTQARDDLIEEIEAITELLKELRGQ